MPAYIAKAQRTDWATPKWLYEKLDAEFHFTLDPCHLKSDTMDGLIIPWAPEVAFANPPYGRPLKRWVAKAYNESQRGATVVMLLPSRTDTAWFHDYCLKAEVRFIRGRLKFGDGKNSAPFPSMVVVFRPTAGKRSGPGGPPPGSLIISGGGYEVAVRTTVGRENDLPRVRRDSPFPLSRNHEAW